ncbi:nuclear distribution protein [Plectosphaerella cucumerina]|uniref:Nuclear distribution protein n=1 Tax=Plectosphaerella cucumerina TaxID=40658 RepID=A0A8K0TT11_9PEZI|nr:nuclear distribution protein [Plectosphaerella cucumerina]
MASHVDSPFSSTVKLLEARLSRIEHLLFGAPVASPSARLDTPATENVEALERRFHNLLGQVKVYAELIKLYRMNPSLFNSNSPSEPPIDLSPEAIRATVIASASSYPATASSLTSVSDCPIPDPSQSAALAALIPRLRGIAATQTAQKAEAAELRARSEAVIQAWYEDGVLGTSRFVADVEGRLTKIERQTRKAARDHAAEEVY